MPLAGRRLELARAAYREISLYAPDRSPCAIDLSDNTNLFGAPPAALVTVRETAESVVTRYPSLYTPDLKVALAAYARTDPAEIVTGCGSDDVLDSAIRAVTEPGDLIAMPDPSFAMIPIFARMNGLRSISIPLRPDLDIDADALLATGARVIYVCTPNNPTGTLAGIDAVHRIIDGAPGVVIIDEAYAEFAGDGFIADAPRHEHVLVVRTFSKAFGLAGLRIGYAAGNAALVAEVEKSRGPYKVNALAEGAAAAALTYDGEWVRRHIAEAIANRARLVTELQALGVIALPSQANFVLIPVAGAVAIAAALRRRGIAVRPMADLPLIGDALRISIGPWWMMEAFVERFRETLASASGPINPARRSP
jgi:histidinol-phosphate aminotransferase